MIEKLSCKMKIQQFKLERYLAKHEFTAPYLLCCSDCEPLNLKELLSNSDEESIALWDNLNLGYTDSQGHPLLREEIAKSYNGIKPKDLLIVTPEEGIFLTMNVLLEANDHVIVTFPGYQSLYELANSLGCRITKWLPTDLEGWKFDINFLKAQITKKTKLIVINFPHNPTGSLMTREDFAELIEIVRDNNIFLFSDEMYRFLEYDSHYRLDSACEKYEKAITLFGLSKTFGLPGLRIGWLAIRDKDTFRKISEFKDYTTICSSAPSEILAIMALRAKSRLINRNLGIIKKNLALLDTFFAKNADILKWNRPKAGTIALPQLLLKYDIYQFCQDLLNNYGVVLLPSDVYDYKGNYFRIGFGRRNMPKALEKFEFFLSDIQN
jgi:aspartate/methionine/tyrosine aminotransferase